MADDHDEQLLLALADGSYVLSTPDGVVAECGAGVAALLDAPDAVGDDVSDLLLAGAAPLTRAAFERLLRDGGGETVTTPSDPGSRALELLVVPVPLALGWEFTALLRELGTRDPESWSTEALRRRHERAVDTIVAARSVRPGGGGEPAPRLAGVLIVVGEAGSPPLRRADVQVRAVARLAAARDAEEAARRAALAAKPGPQGAVADADADATAHGLEDLVADARMLRERLEDTQARVAEATAAREELLAEVAALRAAFEEESERRAVAEAEAEGARAELEAVRHVEASVGEEAGTLRAELDAARDEAVVLGTELGAAREEAASLRAELDGAREESAALRTELDLVTGDRDAVAAALASAEASTEAARAETEAARSAADRLAGEADSARAAAHALRAEFALDPLGVRAERSEATALIAFDGTFERPDDAFCALLGYRADELRSVRWPSVIDRENLEAHKEIARRLRAGEIESAEVETCYMHGGGLLVPVAGTMSLAHDSEGEPTHFLFRVDVSRTAGSLASGFAR